MRGGQLLSALVGALIGALALVLLRPVRETASLPPPASDPRLGEIVDALARLEQKLDALERAPRPREASSERAPVPAQPPGDADPLPPDETEQLRAEIEQLSLRVDLLLTAWKERAKPAFELPTLEQVHAARRDVDWKWIGELAELYLKDEDAAQEKVRLMTFDQLLKRAGVPTGIRHDDGSWMYLKPEGLDATWRGLYFGFVGDCVSWVRTDK